MDAHLHLTHLMLHGWLFKKKLDKEQKEYKQNIFIKLRSLKSRRSSYKERTWDSGRWSETPRARIHEFSLMARALAYQQNLNQFLLSITTFINEFFFQYNLMATVKKK